MNILVRGLRASVAALTLASGVCTAGVVLGPSAYADYATVAATTAVNVRRLPTTSSGIVGVLGTGQTVAQTGPTQNGWAPVRYNGGNYWISATYLRLAAGVPAPSSVIGRATATTTVNVRQQPTTLSAIIGQLPVGQAVDVTGPASNGWTPVNFQGKPAFIASQYLRMGSTTVPLAPSTTTGLARANSWVNVRAQATTLSAILGRLNQGDTIATRGPSVNGWTPVTYQGQAAFVSSQYLDAVTSTPTPAPAPTPIALVATGQAVANTTVNVRLSATTLSTNLGQLPQGQKIGTTGPDKNGWTPVIFNGQAAWIATRYLTPVAAPTPTPTPTPTTPIATGSAVANTTVNVRLSATTASTLLGQLAQGATIATTGTSRNGWTPVIFNGKAAWIASQYLNPVATTAPAPALVATGTRYATTTVNVRSGPSTSYDKVGALPQGDSIGITGRVQNGWNEVIFNGAARWISGVYLSTTKPAADPEPNPIEGPSTGVVAPSTLNLIAKVKAQFPQIKTVYTLRAGSTGDHGMGYAADFMLPDYRNNAELGYAIALFAKDNAAELDVQYVMYRYQIWNIDRDDEGWRAVADRGNDTSNHVDHVHVSMKN